MTEVQSNAIESDPLSDNAPYAELNQIGGLQDSGAMETGERMLLWCEGGPSIGRAVRFPPPLEIEVEGGVYVLVDDGPPENWHYAFVTESHVTR